jgi:hypothetical protein
LSADELRGRFAALAKLAAGKLRPPLPAPAKPAAEWKMEIRNAGKRKTPLLKMEIRKGKLEKCKRRSAPFTPREQRDAGGEILQQAGGEVSA